MQAAPSGSTVLVRAGSYPELEVDGDSGRTALVTIRPARDEVVSVDGLTLRRTALMRFEGFELTGPVLLREGARRIEIAGNHLPGQPVWLRDTVDVLVEGNHIHDIPASADAKIGVRLLGDRGAVIRGNLIENLVEDPIQVAGVEGALVEGNLVRGAHPADREHTDALQVVGADGLVIRGNEFRDVEHGLMFTNAQATDVTIENNVVADTDGVGMKAEGTYGMPNLRVLGNTFHDTRHGVDLRTAHPGAVIANNIFGEVGGLGSQPVATHNLVAEPRGGDHGRNAMLRAPRYTDAVSLELAAGSPGIDAGTSTYGRPADRHGRRRFDDPRARNAGDGPIDYADVGAHERTLDADGSQQIVDTALSPATGGVTPAGRDREGTRAAGARLLVAHRIRLVRARRSGIRVRLRTPAGIRRAQLQLRRAGRAVARRTIRVHGRRARVRLRPRRLRAGRYVLVVRLHDSAGRSAGLLTARMRLVR